MDRFAKFKIEKIVDPDVYTYAPGLEITFFVEPKDIQILRDKLKLLADKASRFEIYWFSTVEQAYCAIDPDNYPHAYGLTVLELAPDGDYSRIVIGIELGWDRIIDGKKILPVIDALGLNTSDTLAKVQDAMISIYDDYHDRK